MIKNIIFDWSGVVKDCVEDQLFIVNKIFKEFGAAEISLQEFRGNWVQPYMAFYNMYLPELTFEQEQIAYRKAIIAGPAARPYPGIVEAIKKLKQRGIQMVVVSSDLPETLHSEITRFSLEDVFIDIVTDVHDKSRAIEELINKNNFDKSDTIIVGDSNHEITAGKNIGIKTIGVTWGFTNENKIIAEDPDFVVRNLKEFEEVFRNI